MIATGNSSSSSSNSNSSSSSNSNSNSNSNVIDIVDDRSSQHLLSSFATILTSLDKERLQLKGLAALQTLCSSSSSSSSSSDSIIDRLNDIQSTIIRLERMTEDIETSLSEEENELANCSVMMTMAKNQSNDINNIIIPSYLRDVTIIDDHILKQKNMNTKPWGAAIEVAEFDKVSTVVRGRLTLTSINDTLRTIKDMVLMKQKLLSLPKKKRTKSQNTIVDEYLSLKTEEHGQTTFLSESEIRASSVFDQGDSTGKAVLNSLRSLGRIKVIRSSSISTYIVV